MKRSKTPAVEPIELRDEPSMAERLQRGLRRALSNPAAASDSASAEGERAACIEGARAVGERAELGVYGGMNENFVLVAGRSRWQADGV